MGEGRSEALVSLALAALDGTHPWELCDKALRMLNGHLDAGVAVAIRRSGEEGSHRSLPFPILLVPSGDEEQGGVTIEVCCSPGDRLEGADVVFVEAVAGVLGRAAAAHMSTELLRYQAFHDPLTGLPNRAALNEDLQARLREGISVAALVCDLDGLKSVNDRYGHRAGDEAIVASAARIRQASRDTDLVARTGGDEFVVACAEMSLSDARCLAERIGRAVAAPLDFEGGQIEIGVSIGIAMSGERHGMVDLLDAADLAMYRTKERRRVGLRRPQGMSGSPPGAPSEPLGREQGGFPAASLAVSRRP